MSLKTPPKWMLPAALALWIGTYFGARFALSQLPSGNARLTVALSPVIPTLVVVWAVLATISRLDELQRRVHFEATAIAFTLTTAMLWVLGLLELAISLDRDNLSYRHVWAFLPAFYFIGLAASWRRYK
ncbi:MAG: hypothetical protein SFZ24_11060 [Planctomycetota bacterium]|nr:hypothetical protein [Planctomycetota bacterium]